MLSAARAASRLLVLDGCPMDCARRTLEGVGLSKFHHLRATELMGEERETIPVEPALERLVKEGQALLKAR
jgi:uncharacterized metal-binding protein